MQFIEQANNYHPAIKLMAEISEKETTFLDTSVYKGQRFGNNLVLDVRTHFKPTANISIYAIRLATLQELKKASLMGKP